MRNEKLNSSDIFNELSQNFLKRCSENEIVIKKGLEFDDFDFYTDRLILNCALIALIENAFIGSPKKGSIEISMTRAEGSIVFSVHNKAVMSAYVQLQVFRNREGIGTYGAKLFIEKYLKGSVYYTSVEGLGTTFYLKLPLLMIC
ncbi:MAG: hypothetical protein COB98_01965 [Flavobacteriaceae bacterium]|nr:MAG: hypothetical protein COB98_01965 [Flavobacteriaceae bacterium]